jgi:hypothetical protein
MLSRGDLLRAVFAVAACRKAAVSSSCCMLQLLHRSEGQQLSLTYAYQDVHFVELHCCTQRLQAMQLLRGQLQTGEKLKRSGKERSFGNTVTTNGIRCEQLMQAAKRFRS